MKGSDEVKKFKEDINHIKVPAEIDAAIDKGIKKIYKNTRRKKIMLYLLPIAAVFLIIIGIFKYNSANIIGEIKKPKVNSRGVAVLSSYENLKSILKSCENNDAVKTTMSPKLGTSADKSTADVSYSTTNIQVEGVDEPDIVKNDDRYIYSISSSSNSLHIVDTYSGTKKMKSLAAINFKDFIPHNMFIKDNQLIVLGNEKNMNYTGRNWGISDKALIYTGGDTEVLIYNIQDKKKPKLLKTFSVSGQYRDARLINNEIYIVSNKEISNIKYNEKEVTPFYSDSSLKEKTKAIAYKDIIYDPKEVYPDYVIISSINLANMNSEAKVKAFLGKCDTIYCSSSNIYAASSTDGNNTSIYKFKLSGDRTDFIGKAELQGSLINQFSMDEYNGALRVAVTRYGDAAEDMSNSLYVLDENMKFISKLEKLEKGEKIYSVRFMEDKAYMVTFKLTDPLLAIDLSDSKAPKVMGELKISGFSTYIQPYDKNHIIGFGRNSTDVVENGIAMARPEGMKLAMFDVSDIKSPKQMCKLDIEGDSSSSPVLYDSKALLINKEKGIIAFPVTLIKDDNRMFSGVYVYKIDVNKGVRFLGTLGGGITVTNDRGEDVNNTIEQASADRVIYIGNTLYAISDSGITASAINNLDDEGYVNF